MARLAVDVFIYPNVEVSLGLGNPEADVGVGEGGREGGCRGSIIKQQRKRAKKVTNLFFTPYLKS